MSVSEISVLAMTYIDLVREKKIYLMKALVHLTKIDLVHEKKIYLKKALVHSTYPQISGE